MLSKQLRAGLKKQESSTCANFEEEEHHSLKGEEQSVKGELHSHTLNSQQAC